MGRLSRKNATALAFAGFFLLASYAFAPSLFDTTQTDFDAGTKTQTISTSDGNVTLDLETASDYYFDGNFTSKIFDTGIHSLWSSLIWHEAGHYGEELPNSCAYQQDANMSGNALLWHMNEPSGAISDSSGNGNDGTASGSPAYGATGKFGNALDFDGINDYARASDSTSIDLNQEFTISLWFSPDEPFDVTAKTVQGLIDKGSYKVFLDKSDGKMKAEIIDSSASYTELSYNGSQEYIYSLFVYDGNLFAGQGSGSGDGDIYTFDGTTWTRSYDGAQEYITSFAEYDGNLMAGQGASTGDGDILTYDGTTWSVLYNGDQEYIYSLFAYDGNLFAGQGSGTGDGDVLTYDGTNWTTSFNGDQEYIYGMGTYDGNLFAGQGATAGDGDIYTFDGTNWSLSYDGPATAEGFLSFVEYDGNLWAGQGTSGGDGDVYTYDGTNWSLVYNNGLNYRVNSLVVLDNELYAAQSYITGGADIVKYNGIGWAKAYDCPEEYLMAMAVYNGEIYAGQGTGTGDGDVYKGVNKPSWSASFDGQQEYIEAFGVYDGNLFAGQGSGSGDGDIYTFDGSSWNLSYDGAAYNFISFAVFDGNLFAGQGYSSGQGDIYTYDGSNWNMSFNGPRDQVNDFAIFDGNIYASMGNDAGEGDVYRFDGGTTWTLFYDGGEEYIYSLVVYDGNLYAGQGSGTGDGDVLVYSNGGWSTSYDGEQEYIYRLTVYDGKLYAGQGSGGDDGDILVFDGQTWSVSYDGSQEQIRSFSVYDGRLYAGQGSGTGDGDILVFDGSSWLTAYDGEEEYVTALAVYDANLFAGKGASTGNGDIIFYGLGRKVESASASWDTNYHFLSLANDGSEMSMYIDGVLESSAQSGISLKQNSLGLLVGKLYGGRSRGTESGQFKGKIDEVSIWNRALGADEILDLYRRGALDLKFQATQCSDPGCADANFVGPDGTTDSFFTDGNFSWDLNAFGISRYFQYKAIFSTTDTNALKGTTPTLLDVNVSYAIGDVAPDVNIVLIEALDDDVALAAFSYARDLNLTIDFNVFDDENDSMTVDINYSATASAGTGAVVVKGLSLSSAVCGSEDWNVGTVACHWDWNISEVADGNYYILIDVNDGTLIGRQFSNASLMIDNTAPSVSWDGNHNIWQGFDANIHLACNDGNGSMGQQTMFRLDADKTNLISWGGWETYGGTAGLMVRGDGNWAVDFNCIDNAGNSGDVNSFFVLIGPHGRLRTFKENAPRAMLGFGEKITLRFDVNLGVIPPITIFDKNGAVIVDAVSMGDVAGSGPDFNSYDYNYALEGTQGWYDVKVGSQFFDDVFYQVPVWADRYTSDDANAFPFSFDLNVYEPDLMQRWFVPVDVRVDFNYNAAASSVRVLDFNGSHYLEVPSQLYDLNISGNCVIQASLVFLASLDRNETRNFFVDYTTVDKNKSYSADLNDSVVGFVLDLNNSMVLARIDLNKGGVISLMKSRIGKNLDLNGYNPMLLSPETRTGPITYGAYLLTNPSYTREATGNLASKLFVSGTVGIMDYNIRYTAYAKNGYVLVDTNARASSSATWQYYTDSYLFAVAERFSRFSGYANGVVSSFDVNAKNTTWSVGDKNFLALYDINSLESVAEIFLKRESSETMSVTNTIYDEQDYTYWKRSLYAGTVSAGSYFNTRSARTVFNPWSGYSDLNELLWKLENPVVITTGPTKSSDSEAPVNFSIGHTPSDANDSADLNCYSTWGDNILLDFVDINVSGPNLNVQERQTARDTNKMASYVVGAGPLEAGIIDCNFTAYDIAGNQASATTRFSVKDYSAPSVLAHAKSPDTNAGIDPQTRITVDANVNEYSGISQLILYTRQYFDSNASWSDWNAISMFNDANVSDYNYHYTAPFTTADENSIWEYRIYAKDVNGYDSNMVTQAIYAYWEWTWSLAPGVFGNKAGSLDDNVTVGDLNISNTGDKTLNFKITSNWTDKDKVYYGGAAETSSGQSFSLASGATTSYAVVVTAKTAERNDDLNITINPSEALSSPDQNYATATVISLAGGPFMLIEWTDTNTNVTQGNTDVTYEITLKNAGNMDANAITMGWTLPSNWTITTGDENSTSSALAINDTTTNTLIVTIGTTATTGSRTVTFMAGCCDDSSKTKTSTQIVTVNAKGSDTSEEGNDDSEESPGGSGGLGGGGGGSGGGGGTGIFTLAQRRNFFQTTSEVFEIIRGQDQKFAITLKNPLDGTLKNLKIEVTGLLSKYLKLTQDTIETLDTNQTQKIYTEITSAGYFTPGKHTLTYTITGTLLEKSGKETPFTETRTVTLLIHETTRQQALAYLEEIQQITRSMQEKQLNTTKIEQWQIEASNYLENKEYDELKKTYDKIKIEYGRASQADSLIVQLNQQIQQAKQRQVPTPSTERILTLAMLAFQRGEYETALKRLEEAQLTYSMETKGEFNVINFLATNWQSILLLSIILAIVFYFLRQWIKWGMLNRKLQQLETEEALLMEMIKETQQRCFVQNKMSMGEYYDALKQFESTLSNTIEKTIEYRAEKNNLFRFKPAIIRLEQEKSDILKLIQKTQKQYFEQGLIESRIYHTKMKSFTQRITKIEKEIVLKQATAAIRKKTGWKKPIWK